MLDVCSPVSSCLVLREQTGDVPSLCVSSLMTSHCFCTASRVRRALELRACAVCSGLLSSVRMSSVGSLWKLLGALSLDGRVECSSSILNIIDLKYLGNEIVYTLGNQSPSFPNFLPPNQMRTDEIQCLC